MGHSIKELIVVLIISATTFSLAKRVALRFCTEADFLRRRNVWFALTTIAFLSPSFWLYAAIAIPLLVLNARKDSNPPALYLLLLHVIPPVSANIPFIGNSNLISLNNELMLSLCVIVPAARRILRSKNETRIRGLHI